MYASLTTFKSAPGKRAECEGLADKLFSVMKGMKGFKNVVYFGDSDNNEYGSFLVSPAYSGCSRASIITSFKKT